MELAFCVETLENALARHGKPDIFNTDQGSQFTGAAFTGAAFRASRHRYQHGLPTRLRLRPTRCISWRGWCKWTPVEPAGTCPGYKSSKLDGSEDPWTTGARDEHTAIGGGSLA